MCLVTFSVVPMSTSLTSPSFFPRPSFLRDHTPFSTQPRPTLSASLPPSIPPLPTLGVHGIPKSLQGVEPVLGQIKEVADAVRGLGEVGCGCVGRAKEGKAGEGGREGGTEWLSRGWKCEGRV